MEQSSVKMIKRRMLSNSSGIMLRISFVWCFFFNFVAMIDTDVFEAAFQGQCPSNVSRGICQHICHNHSPRTFACYCLPGFHLQHNGYECSNETEYSTSPAVPSMSSIRNQTTATKLFRLEVLAEHFSTKIPSCDRLKCQNGGWCEENLEDGATCSCPLGTAGKYCHKRVGFLTPHFSGKSYALLPLLATQPKTLRLDIAMTIRPEKEHGLFFYVGQDLQANKDFLALLLIDGHVVMRINITKTIVVIRSRHKVSLDKPAHIMAGRNSGSDFYLRVEPGELQITSMPNLNEVELKTSENVFIGGLIDPKNMQTFKTPISFFHGCIMDLKINEQQFILQPPPFGSIINGINIDRCQTEMVADEEAPSCVKIDCMNGGRCIILDNGRDTQTEFCDCAVGFVGSRCGIDLESSIPFFIGSSYLSYEVGRLKDEIKHHFHLRLVFRPSQLPRPASRHEILLHLGSNQSFPGFSTNRSSSLTDDTEDWLTISLMDGWVEVTMNLGDGITVTRSKEAIRFGEWCEVEVRRTGRLLELYVDNDLQEIVKSSGTFVEFDFDSGNPSNDERKPIIFVGGVPGVAHGSEFGVDVSTDTFFHGCIDLNKSTFMDLKLSLSKAYAASNLENVCPT